MGKDQKIIMKTIIGPDWKEYGLNGDEAETKAIRANCYTPSCKMCASLRLFGGAFCAPGHDPDCRGNGFFVRVI
jgi:hypothetical protein